MSRVEKAIESGRCALAVSGSLLRDPEVMLALTNRAALTPMALHGPAVSPVVPVSAEGIARAVSQPGGVVVVVEPEGADQQGLEQLGALLKRGKHKPDILVVARAYNPFAFGTALSGLQVGHEKGRGKAFIEDLPEPPPEEELPDIDVAAVTKKKKGGDIAAPRFQYVDREDETAQLVELLGTGGPVVVHGPEGVGRTWLVEHAIAATELSRLPDLVIAWGSGFDTLAARLAVTFQEAGDSTLVDLLKGKHTMDQVRDAVKSGLDNEALASKVMVIRHLEHGLGREGDFFRKSRLELLLETLLTHPGQLRLVFHSTRVPVFYREGQAAALRTMAVGGIKGRFLHELFASYKAIEFPREKFGPIYDRTHGHALAARTLAVLTRVRQDGEKIVDDPKFMKMDDLGDLKPLKKQLQKRVDKLDKKLRATLSKMAHLRYPIDAQAMSAIGIHRAERLELLALGLLDMVGTENDRKHAVHPLVRTHLSYREISDFGILTNLAEDYAGLARKLEGLDKLACEQEQTRCAISGRTLRLRARLDLPDHDQWLESCIGMLRAKNPRLDLVEQRLNEALKANPSNSDAWLLKLDLLHKQNAKNEAVEALIAEAIEAAPVPELFQSGAGVWMARRARNKAITLLEQGVQLLPDEPRLKTRLASLLLRVGRRPEAIDLLKAAMVSDPMLPDPYGLLGQAKRDEGTEALEEAEQLLREAVRLAPEDAVQVGRLVDLLLARARVEPDNAAMLRDSAKEMLDDALKGERRAPEAHLLLATLVREQGTDLERADWLLKKARKHTDRNHDRWRRISIERALLDMARGNLDAAENAIRQQIAKDPSAGEAFAALGLILEARQQYVPAHAEYMRAKERTAQNSLDCRLYDQALTRVQGIIEAQAAGLWKVAEGEAEAPAPAPAPATAAPRVIRREGKAADEAAPATTADSPDDVPTVVEAAPEPAPAEGAAPAPAPAEEAAPAPAEAAPAEEAAPAPEEAAPAEATAPAEETAPPPAPAESTPSSEDEPRAGG